MCDPFCICSLLSLSPLLEPFLPPPVELATVMVPALGELPVRSVQAPGCQGCVGCQVPMLSIIPVIF